MMLATTAPDAGIRTPTIPATLLEPFWTCYTMRAESLLFVEGDEGVTARLLFPPDDDLALTSATGDIRFEAGRDFVVDWQSGRVIRPEGSRIPFASCEELRPPLSGPLASPMRRRGNSDRGLMFAE